MTCIEKVEAWPQGKCVEHLTHDGKEYCAKIVYLSPRFFCQDYVQLKGTDGRTHKHCIKMITIYGKKYHIVFCKEKGKEIKIELSEDGLGRPILIESTSTDSDSKSDSSGSFVTAHSENPSSTTTSSDDVEVRSSSTATTSEDPSLDDDDTSSEGDVIVSSSATTTEVPSNEIPEEDSDSKSNSSSKSDSDSNSDSSGSVVIETQVGHVTQTTTHSESNSSSNTQVVGNTTI